MSPLLQKPKDFGARVRFIFLHTPLLEPQGWKEDV